MVVLTILAGLGWGGYKVWKAVDPFATTEPEGCRVVVLGQSYDLDLEQSQNAAIITAESIRRGLPTRAAAIALTTAMQESKSLPGVGNRQADHGSVVFVGKVLRGTGEVQQLEDRQYQ